MSFVVIYFCGYSVGSHSYALQLLANRGGTCIQMKQYAVGSGVITF